jgi:hypothetical protein
MWWMQKIFFGFLTKKLESIKRANKCNECKRFFFWLKTLESIKRANKYDEWMQKIFFGFLTKRTIESTIKRAAEDLRPQNDSSNNFKNQKPIS